MALIGTMSPQFTLKTALKSHTFYLFCALTPLFIAMCIFRVNKVLILPDSFPDQGWGHLLLPNLSFFIGVFCLFYLALIQLSGKVQRKLFCLLLTLLVVLSFIIEYAAADYFSRTLDPLFNFSMLAYAYNHWADTSQVVVGTLGKSGVYGLLLAAIFLLIYSVILTVFTPEAATLKPSRKKLTVIAVLASIGLYLPIATFAHNPTIALIYSMLPNNKYELLSDKNARFSYARDAAISRKNDTQQRNLVFVILESTRFSATSLGSQLGTTPFLKSLARQSLTSDNTFVVVPHTSKALIAILCGINPVPTPKAVEAQPGRLPVRCLPELLKSQGYQTAFFQTANPRFEQRKALVENLGVETFYSAENINKEGFEPVNYFGIEDMALIPHSKQWLEALKDKPFFATYLTLISHHNYGTPSTFKKSRYSDNITYNDYLNTLRYTDTFVKTLLDQYKALGLYENTVFVIVGDHGEGFGEHSRLQHNATIHNEGIHVPLIIHFGDKSIRGKINTLNNHLDILPTSLDAMNFNIDGGGYLGASLLDDNFQRTAAYSRCWQKDVCLSMINDNWKYIYHFDHKEEELFNLQTDPLEKDNLVKKMPLRLGMMREHTLNWRARLENTYFASPDKKQPEASVREG